MTVPESNSGVDDEDRNALLNERLNPNARGRIVIMDADMREQIRETRRQLETTTFQLFNVGLINPGLIQPALKLLFDAVHDLDARLQSIEDDRDEARRPQ